MPEQKDRQEYSNDMFGSPERLAKRDILRNGKEDKNRQEQIQNEIEPDITLIQQKQFS